MEQEQRDWMEENLACLAKNLSDASTALADMDVNDDGFKTQVQTVDSLTKDYQTMLHEYNDILNCECEKNKKDPWYRKLDWTKILTTSAVIVASIGQSFAIYKWQRDGYLIGRDAAKVPMPRP